MKYNIPTWFLVFLFLTACNSDDDELLSDANVIVAFDFMANDNDTLSENFSGKIDIKARTVQLELPFGTDLEGLVPRIVIPEEAKISPGSDSPTDFSEPVLYTVTAANGDSAEYTVVVRNAAPTDREVLLTWYQLNPENTLSWDLEDITENWEGITVKDGRVSSVSFPEKEMTLVTPLVRHLDSLKSLNLRDNTIQELPEGLGALKKLEALNLSSNELRALPSDLGSLEALRLLNLRNNQIEALPPTIGSLEQLMEINLDFNRLEELPVEIGSLDLISLSVYGNRDLTTLPEALGNNIRLMNLNVGWCNLSSLPNRLEDLISLVELNASENQLSEVPEGIGNLTALKRVMLQKNQLIALPDAMGELSSLLVLEIQENNITTLPAALCERITENNVVLNKDPDAQCE